MGMETMSDSALPVKIWSDSFADPAEQARLTGGFGAARVVARPLG